MLAGLVGCSSGPVAPPSVDCGPEGADVGRPATFADVEALFVRRCAAGSACHGPGGQGSLSLVGPDVYDALVAHPAAAYPALPRVTPGHPEQSFLWLKLDGCYRDLPGCSDVDRPCGEPMPPLSPISEGFSLQEADVLRAWIVEGAPR